MSDPKERVQGKPGTVVGYADFRIGFIWAGLGLAIYGGFAIGTYLALLIGFDLAIGEGFYSFVQTHGHLQLVGWAGLFIMGISLHFIPRLAGVPIARPRQMDWVLGLVVGGLVLRGVGQLLLPAVRDRGLFAPVSWAVAASGVIEATGIGLYLFLLFDTLRRARQAGERPALAGVKPFFEMMVAGWATYAFINAVLTVRLAFAAELVLDPGWNEFAVQTFTGLVLLPVVFAFSVRMFPLYLRLAPPDWPVRTVALAYLFTLALFLLPKLPPILKVTPEVAVAVSSLGSVLRGAVIFWFVWCLDVLTRRRDPWIVHRKFHPGPDRRPTREGIPDYGEFGRFERLVYSSYTWLVLGALVEIVVGLFALFGHTLPVSRDVARHLYLLGFVTLLILGMAVRMIPGFIKQQEVASRALVDATFWLANAAVVTRVLPLLLPSSLLAAIPGSIWFVKRALGLSGVLGLAAVACLAANLWKTAQKSSLSTKSTMTRASKRVYAAFSGSFVAVLVIIFAVNLALVSDGQGKRPFEAYEGYRLMQRYGCLSCHRVGGKGSSVGPTLNGVALRHDRRWLQTWVRNPWAVKPGSPMPVLRLPPEHLNKIVDFLMTLKDVGPDSSAAPDRIGPHP